jgi:hypothetical protein
VKSLLEKLGAHASGNLVQRVATGNFLLRLGELRLGWFEVIGFPRGLSVF